MTLRLAVIGTFFKRHELNESLSAAIRAQTRAPDELWLIGEGEDDVDSIGRYDWGPNAKVRWEPTPLDWNGNYGCIPYSWKINNVLETSDADLFVYLDNGSIPRPDKYRAMAECLEETPEIGAVYCAQQRNGAADVCRPRGPVPDAFCLLNYTQVMHRKTACRWPLDLAVGGHPDTADAWFWRGLHKEVGPFYGVALEEVLDEHPFRAAVEGW